MPAIMEEIIAFSNFEKIALNLNSKVEFVAVSLQQLLNDFKLILLFLEFNNDNLLSVFDKCCEETKIKRLLMRHYWLLGWDMQYKDTHKPLEEVLTNLGLTEIADFIESETSVILIINQVNQDKKCSYLTSSCLTAKDLFEVLKNMVKYKEKPLPEMILMDRNCEKPEDYEVIAANRFAKFYSSKFGNGLKFQEDLTLEEVLLEGKVVVFYLHFKTDNLLESFNKFFLKPQVKKALEMNCLLLGWHLEQEVFCEVLQRVLEQQKVFKNTLDTFDAKLSSILIAIPGGDCIVISDENMGEDDFLNILADQIQTNYINGINNKPTSQEFQQIIMDNYNLHGQRDYDNYEYYQLDKLKKNIVYAFYGPPTKNKGYSEDCKKRINHIFDIILRENNEIAKYKDRVVIFIIFVCIEPLDSVKNKRAQVNKFYKPEKDWSKRVVFVLRRCKSKKVESKRDPCRIFIDDVGRVYDSWDNYLNNNKFEKCNMIFPKDGRYQNDTNGKVIFDQCQSPACGLKAKAKSFIETTATVSGIGGLAVLAVSAAVPVAPVVVAVTIIGGGISAIANSAWNITDKRKRKEDLSFSNPEARFEYFNLIGGLAGAGGGTLSAVVGQLVNKGVNIGRGVQVAVNTVNVASVAVCGFAIANDAFTMLETYIKEDRPPSRIALTQLTASILFFGHAAYNFQLIGGVIDERQTQILKGYESSLESKNQQKMFTKLTKETMRQNSGQVQKGRAEIIKFLNNVDDPSKLFSKIASSNKTMNKNGVKFSAENGQLKLNGISVDINKFNKMSNRQIGKFVSNLPSNSTVAQPNPDITQINNATSWLNQTFSQITFDQVLSEKCLAMLNNPKEEVMKFILDIGQQLIQKMVKDMFSFESFVEIQNLLEIVGQWIHEKITEIDHDYKKWKETGDSNLEKWYFPLLPMDDLKRLDEIFQRVVETICVDKQLTTESLEDLKQYFLVVTADDVVNEINEENMRIEIMEKRKNHTDGDDLQRMKTECCVCGGYYYQLKRRTK